MGYMLKQRKIDIPPIEYLGDDEPDSPTLRVLLREHYVRVMPNRRHHRVMIWSVFLTIVAILIVQFAYPLDRGLPFARFGAKSTAYQSHEQLAKLVADTFDSSEFLLVVGDKTYKRPLKLAGAEPDTEKVIAQTVQYPFWQRFIPLSILWQFNKVDYIPVTFSSTRLDALATEAAKALTYPPADAMLAIEDSNLKVGEATSGWEVGVDDIKTALTQMDVVPGGVVTLQLPARELPAKRSLDDLASVRMQAEAALHHSLTVRIEGQTIDVTPGMIASWLALGEDKEGVVHLGLADASIDTFVAELDKKYGIVPGTTHVTVVNGRETGRQVGTDGRKIDAAAFQASLQRQLLKGDADTPINLGFVPVAATVLYNNTYSATRDGLQSYINDISKSRNMRIMIQQLNGEKWAVEARAHESMPSASTYKLFVALALFDRMDRGEIDWGTAILDTNVSGCFERMMVASTNPCAEQFLTLFGGYGAMNQFVYSRGFSHETDFTNQIAKHTSAADLTLYMIGLEQGTLLQGAQRDKLLDALGRHPYRDGIPRGSGGKVNDKVGFLWDYVHDTAIVHHPRGTYVMTIMSKGQSYARIAEVTREIERIMYP